jgi:hypothetical protein
MSEVWAYTAIRSVTAGQYTGSGTASGQDAISQIVSDGDPTNYSGVVVENADFNEDTIVDAADYILWRINSGLASGATHTQGDANSDGAVDGTDYNIWRSQFGTSPSGSGASLAESAAVTTASIDSMNAPVAATLLVEPLVDVRASAANRDVAFATIANERKALPADRGPIVSRGQRIAARVKEADWEQLLSVLSIHRLGHHADQTSDVSGGAIISGADNGPGCQSLSAPALGTLLARVFGKP